MKNLFTSFNRPGTTVVITSFPDPQDGSVGNKGFNAVAWHSRKTLTKLSEYGRVLVLAEKIHKFEARSTKSETNPNIKNSKISFEHLKLRILNLFRVSIFEFRILGKKILKQVQDDKTQTLKINENLTVLRAWEKGNIFSLLSLIPLIMSLKKVKSVFAQFEFNVFGGILPNLTLLVVLLILRLFGKHVTFELHQVITDVGLLKKHVPISNSLLQHFFNISLRIFYIVLGLIAEDIVVFEETLKARLFGYVRSEKIHVLCLSVEKKRVIDKSKARKMLNRSLIQTSSSFWQPRFAGAVQNRKETRSWTSQDDGLIKDDEFVVLVFGFINGYKGIDWIVNALKDINSKPRTDNWYRAKHEYRNSKQYQNSNNKKTKRFDNLNLKHSNLSRISDFGFRAFDKPVRLLIAGGKNPYLKNQPHYQKLYTSIVSAIKKHPHMTYAGFVPDEMVDYYFNAADVVVLPYEVFMSASGPFSLALGYNKPLLLSEKLLPYSDSEDVGDALISAKLTTRDIFFELTKKDLLTHLVRLTDKATYEKYVRFSVSLARLRASDKVVLRLHRILHTPSSIFSVPAAKLKVATEM